MSQSNDTGLITLIFMVGSTNVISSVFVNFTSDLFLEWENVYINNLNIESAFG